MTPPVTFCGPGRILWVKYLVFGVAALAMGCGGGTSETQGEAPEDVPTPDTGSTDAVPSTDAHPQTYDPCPSATACRIMPLGDSITFGSGSSGAGGGYRIPLFRHVLADRKAVTFVGSVRNGPDLVDDQPFPRQSEGHGGFTIDEGGGRQGIYPLVGKALATHKPHIVLLMIGTNDINLNLDLANAAMRLGDLLDRITTTAPDALLVVAQIVPTTSEALNQRVRAYNQAIPGLVEARAAAGRHITMVDMYGAYSANPRFKTEYMADQLHPKDVGYVKMADTWYAAIARWLK